MCVYVCVCVYAMVYAMVYSMVYAMVYARHPQSQREPELARPQFIHTIYTYYNRGRFGKKDQRSNESECNVSADDNPI